MLQHTTAPVLCNEMQGSRPLPRHIHCAALCLPLQLLPLSLGAQRHAVAHWHQAEGDALILQQEVIQLLQRCCVLVRLAPGKGERERKRDRSSSPFGPQATEGCAHSSPAVLRANRGEGEALPATCAQRSPTHLLWVSHPAVPQHIVHRNDASRANQAQQLLVVRAVALWEGRWLRWLRGDGRVAFMREGVLGRVCMRHGTVCPCTSVP